MSLIPKKGTVYVVDDDEGVRDSMQWLLEGKDYRARVFDSAESFLARYDPREVACLFVDIRMGGMTGLELQDRLIERRSPLPIVLTNDHDFKEERDLKEEIDEDLDDFGKSIRVRSLTGPDIPSKMKESEEKLPWIIS